MTAVVCGCVTRSVRQTAIVEKTTREPVISDLSQYMRAVYKLSSESAAAQNSQRQELLAKVPQLAELVTRIEQNPTDSDARSQLVAAYMDHQLYWAAYD